MDIARLLGNTTSYHHRDYSGDISDPAAIGLIAVILVVFLLLAAIMYCVMALLTGRIFKKAGEESWKAWIPVYSNWTLLKLGDQKGFWAIIMLIPLVNLISVIFMYIAYYNIGLKLGKDGVFVLLAMFLPLVWFIWLAVDDSKWNGLPETRSVPRTEA